MLITYAYYNTEGIWLELHPFLIVYAYFKALEQSNAFWDLYSTQVQGGKSMQMLPVSYMGLGLKGFIIYANFNRIGQKKLPNYETLNIQCCYDLEMWLRPLKVVWMGKI